jgi:hypothetical protein
MPTDWAPTDAHRQQANDLGVDVNREAQRFRDHAEMHDRRLASWNAGFRTWLSKANGFKHDGPPKPKQGVIELTDAEAGGYR